VSLWLILVSCGSTDSGLSQETLEGVEAADRGVISREPAELPEQFVPGLPRLAILPFSTANDQVADVLSSVVESSLRLNIRLIGTHELSDASFPHREYSEEAVREFCFSHQLDNVLYGEVVQTDGSYSIGFRVYDAALREMTYEDQYALESVFTVFDAAEEITERVLSNLADRRLAFGSIEIRVDRSEASGYSLHLNGVALGLPDGALNVVAGTYLLEVMGQQRQSLYRKNVVVHGASSVVVDIPGPVIAYDLPPGWFFTADPDGNLWTAVQGGGIGKYLRDKDQWVHYRGGARFPIKADSVVSVLHDGTSLWLSYGNANPPEGLGVTRWNPDTGAITHYGPAEGTPGFTQGGNVWFSALKEDGTVWFGLGGNRNPQPLSFDGTSWTVFPVQGETLNAGASFLLFEGTRGYFKSWQGGLHLYDFVEERWVLSPLGAAGGTGSLFARNFWPSGLAALPGGGVAVFTSEGPPNSNPELGGGDGVWYYDGTDWSNISPSLAGGPGSNGSLAVDPQGRLWCFFEADRSIRIWDGTRWEEWAPLGFVAGPQVALIPRYIDDSFVWMIQRGESGMRIVRARYRS